MKKFAFLMFFLVLCCFSYGKTNEVSKKTEEVQKLVKQIEQLTNNTNSQAQEKFYKNKLSVQQSKLLILNTTLFIYRLLDGAKSFNEIYEIVTVSYECSFIFPELGKDHLDAFIRILNWSYWETRFNKNKIKSWKKGTIIKRAGKTLTIKFDSIDYGAWQVNDQHLKYLKKINKLYISGIIPFKVNNVKTMNDVLHIPTNCVSRCVIESDRKLRDWEWRHEYDKGEFIKKLNQKVIFGLQSQNLYDRQLTQKYYHLIPIKYYRGDIN